VQYRDKFTDQEWQTLQFAPLWTFNAVAAADGDIDQQEMGKLGEYLQNALSFNDQLVREVMSSVALDLGGRLEAYKADSRDIASGLQQCADILDRKVAAEQAQAFKMAMLFIAKNIAEASSDAAGQQVSQVEQNAFALVAVALRVKTAPSAV
jgi:hypothetical protein